MVIFYGKENCYFAIAENHFIDILLQSLQLAPLKEYFVVLTNHTIKIVLIFFLMPFQLKGNK